MTFRYLRVQQRHSLVDADPFQQIERLKIYDICEKVLAGMLDWSQVSDLQAINSSPHNGHRFAPFPPKNTGYLGREDVLKHENSHFLVDICFLNRGWRSVDLLSAQHGAQAWLGIFPCQSSYS